MKQSVLLSPRDSEIQERFVPEVGPEDVQVKVVTCGVCASELHGWAGDGEVYPREYGHEVAGVVVAVGSAVLDFRPGMAVTGLFPKGYAEYAQVNQRYVTQVPAGVAIENALGEPLACVLSGARRTHIELGDTVAVIGLGFMGLLTLQAVRLRGPARLIAIDPRPEARQMACWLGADETMAPEQVPEKLRLTEWKALGKGHGVDVAIEASGTQAGLTLAGEMVHEHGCLSLIGWHQGGVRLVDMELWNWKAIDVVNAHERRLDYLMNCMRRGLALVAAGKLEIGSLITHRFALEHVDDAFESLQGKPSGFIKAVVVF